jgi:hypothetical protein
VEGITKKYYAHCYILDITCSLHSCCVYRKPAKEILRILVPVATTKKAEACLLGKPRLNLLASLFNCYVGTDFLSQLCVIIAGSVY